MDTVNKQTILQIEHGQAKHLSTAECRVCVCVGGGGGGGVLNKVGGGDIISSGNNNKT